MARLPIGLRSRTFRNAWLVMLAACALTFMVLPRKGTSHEPITTKVTFNKEIVRIFQRHCLACHDSQGVANIPLATYTQARPWAKAFKEEVLERRMPPAQPVKGFGSFQNDYALTQQEIDQIVSWVEGGAPKGEDKELPADFPAGRWASGEPDLIVAPQSRTDIPPGEGDEVRCFDLETGLKDDRWLSAIDFHPGNPTIVRRASFGITLSRANKNSTPADQCGEQSPGFESLGTWMPGQVATRLPRGIGQRLPANARLLLQIYYRKTTQAMTDLSSLGLYFSREAATKPLIKISLSVAPHEIPPAADHSRVRASYTLRKTAQAIAIRPLTDPLVRSVEVTAHRPGGTTEVLLLTRDSEDDWQRDLVFKSPVSLPRGTRLEAIANLANPKQAAKAVRFASPLCELSLAAVGDQKLTAEPQVTADEMSGAMLADLFVCPMHADVTAGQAGQCSKCGMTLVRTQRPALADYDLRLTTNPRLVQPGQAFQLGLVVSPPRNSPPPKEFNIVHERPFHLFIVSADLNYFDHVHPEQKAEGTFAIWTRVPRAGLYFAYGDFFPVGGLPQLIRRSLYTAGFAGDLFAARARLEPDSSLTKTLAGVRFALTLDPAEPVAGKQASLTYKLSDEKTGQPIKDLQPYLGAWAHTMVVSEDGDDFIHSHSSITPGSNDKNKNGCCSETKVDLFFPRSGRYRIWSQFQRQGKVITVQHTINVKRF